MIEAIKYNLRHLTQFGGRDARRTFWFYVLFLTLAQIAISFAISIPLTGSMVGDAVVAARGGAGEADIQRRVLEHMGTVMRTTMWSSVILALLTTALMVAAFTRRLHDSNKPGWIALVVVAIQLVSVALIVSHIDDTVQMMGSMQSGDIAAIQEMQGKMAVRGLLGWVPLILTIVFGVLPSTPGENRYGPQPLST
jgi:uncharacterized membrane protein YhaH (DUF805 family)